MPFPRAVNRVVTPVLESLCHSLRTFGATAGVQKLVLFEIPYVYLRRDPGIPRQFITKPVFTRRPVWLYGRNSDDQDGELE
jgi:hypothetical protein